MLQIAHLRFSSPLVLAPLAGYTDLPFRLLCRRFGAGYCVSEMISCHGLVFQQQKTMDMLRSHHGEQPVCFQLFGADPEVMAKGAQIMAAQGADMIDINMGCPVKKVTRRGAGAALMTTPKLASQILEGIVQRVSVPVTVKIRSGKDRLTANAVDFAKMAEDAGVAAITIHGRTWSQGFTGTVDRDMIAMVKKAVAIPVIGNGDVTSATDARLMMEKTGCDGVMIGRGALGNPWIFSSRSRPEEHRAVTAVALQHLQLMEENLRSTGQLGSIKNHLSHYFKGLRGASNMRQRIFAAGFSGALRELLREFSQGEP